MIEPDVPEYKGLQELVRAIVKEIGVAPDPEAELQEKRRQRLTEAGTLRLQAVSEYFKHMTTVSGASIIAVVTIMSAVSPSGSSERWPLAFFGSVLALFACLSASLWVWDKVVVNVTHYLYMEVEQHDPKMPPRFRLFTLLVFSLYAVGLALFGLSMMPMMAG